MARKKAKKLKPKKLNIFTLTLKETMAAMWFKLRRG